MSVMQKLKPLWGKKSVRGAVLLLGVVTGVVIVSGLVATEEVLDEEVNIPTVTVTTATEFAGGQTLSLIGNVRAATEASVTSEQSGRVVSVPVSLGQTVSAGQVIATLESASQRAAVLQAEGVYDAAVAASAQSGVSVDEAQTALENARNNAVSTYRSAYNTNNGVVVNNIDSFFSAPNSTIPGLRIDGRGFTGVLNAERIAYQTILPVWQAQVNTISSGSDLRAELQYANEVSQRTLSLIDTFLLLFNQQSNSSRYTEAELQTFSTNFTTLRSNLIATQTSLDSALISLQSAEDNLKRAQLSASGSTSSASDAQIKQALGALRAAQANLAKTVLRTPISGTVNFLTVRPGDFVGSFEQVAQVANNNALEIIAYLSDSEKTQVAIGDEVEIEGGFTGVVSKIAPVVDTVTRKTEIRISAENIDVANGETVRVSKELTAADTSRIIVPLSAVRFTIDEGNVFVVKDGVLQTQPVILGNILGGSIEITDGLGADEQFVVDVRGLQAGIEVTVKE